MVLYDITIAVCTVTPDDRQRNCPKHVEFNFQNKFEKLVHLVGFISGSMDNDEEGRTSSANFRKENI
jgi:hypothetical protein